MQQLKGRFAAVLLASLFFSSIGFAQTAITLRDPSDRIDGHYGYWLPTNIANHDYAQKVDLLINWLHVFMAILFVGWGIFFVYCLLRFRQRPDHKANPVLVKAKTSKYSEIAVAIFEAILLVGVSIPVWADVKNEFPKPEQNPLRVRVLAEQFQWTFHYPGADGKFGKTSPKFVDTTSNTIGLDKSDPDAKDDFSSGEFHIPKDRPIIAEITSKDVIHSFNIAVLRVKQDANPGMRVPIWFEAGHTGKYEVSCAQLCGNNHYAMRALMVVEEPAQFAAWAVEKAKGPAEFEE